MDDDEPENPYASTIVGTWKITHYGSTAYWIAWSKAPTTFTFKSNGTYSTDGDLGDATGTYTLDSNHITTYVNGKIYIQYDIVTIDDGIAILDMYPGTYSDTRITVKCKKI
jgi:hypothetical protein